MNGWDTIQHEGKPVLQLLENFLGTQGENKNAPCKWGNERHKKQLPARGERVLITTDLEGSRSH